MSYTAQRANLIHPNSDLIEDVKSVIDLFENDIWLPASSSSKPLILYHYTSVEGLIGILESCSLWCTDVKYLNDPIELKYGKKLIYDKLQGYLKMEENAILNAILKNLSQIIGILHKYDVYISCFSQEDNLLSQWKNYASKGKGFNLGIEFNTECDVRTKTACIGDISKEHYPVLRRVVYEEKEQNFIIEDFISKIIRSTKEALKSNDEIDWPPIVLYASNVLIELMLSFKNHNFREEREWRLITVLDKKYKQELRKFRVKDNEVVPYLDNYLYENANGITEFPLRTIKSGPGLEDERTLSTIDLLLQNKAIFSKNIIINSDKVSISNSGYSIK